MSAATSTTGGKVVFVAELEAKPERLEEFKERIYAVLAHANSDKEPGTVTYRVLQSETKFLVFEEYADLEANHFHLKTEPFLQLKALFADALAKPLSGQYWQELTIRE